MIDRLFENVTDEDIRQLIEAGEGPQIEFKTDVRSILDLAKIASAFANSQGGVLLVGVQEPDVAVGCSTARIGHLVNELGNRIRPMPEVRMHSHTYQGAPLAVVVFKRTAELAVSDAGAFRRVGEKDQLLTGQMLQEMFPPEQPPEVTNQHIREMFEALNERLAAVQERVNYPHTWRGRIIAFAVGFGAGLFGRMLGAWLFNLLSGAKIYP